MRKIRLDDSCLNHLTNILVGFTRKSLYRLHTYILRNHIPKILCILLTGGAYAPDATCIATPLSGADEVPQKLKQLADVVYRFSLQKR